jgi:hypothetical protein
MEERREAFDRLREIQEPDYAKDLARQLAPILLAAEGPAGNGTHP